MNPINYLMELIPGYSILKPTPIELTAIKNRWVIRNVTVIDMIKGSAPKICDVLISGNKITDIYPTAKTNGIMEGEVIDGTGKFLIPSLIDSHCHITNYIRYWMENLYIAAGVTSVRDMATPKAFWKILDPGGNLNNPQFKGPRIFPVAGFFDGDPGVFGWAIIPKNRDEVIRYLDEIVDCGISAIKLYSYLKKDMFEIIVKEAAKRNLYIAGHVPLAVDMIEAAQIGMNEFEHYLGVPETILGIRDSNFMKNIRFQGHYWLKLKDKTFELRKLAAKMKEYQTVHVPTISVVRGMSCVNAPQLMHDYRHQFVSEIIINLLWSKNFPGMNTIKDTDFESMRNSFLISTQYTQILKEEGVTILAGTDSPVTFSIPGFSIHDELKLLVKYAGFKPEEALASATREASKVIGVENKIGTIRQGMIADMVLLDKNPLEDIENVSKINMVIFNGKIAKKEEIDAKLSKMSTEYYSYFSRKILNPILTYFFNYILKLAIPSQSIPQNKS
ncbi:MAG: amidohydrolase family protein [Desulfobacterales bacterium]|nr:amidohydrolase family protein [Desulfobacterales bacterium]